MKDEVTIEVKAARNLREIKRLYRELGSQIIADGISRDIADSNALNFLGPAAMDFRWQAAYDAAEAEAEAREVTFSDYAYDQLAEQHPLSVLVYWDDLIRSERDQPTGLKATVNRSADYLSQHLAWIFGESDGEANFLGCIQFATDLAKCRTALENVLKDGVRFDTSAAACFNDDPLTETGVCGGQLFRRDFKPTDCEHETMRRQVAEWAARPPRKGQKPEKEHPGVTMEFLRAQFPAAFADHTRDKCDLGGRDDIYQCRKCGRRYDESGYWLAVKQHYEGLAG